MRGNDFMAWVLRSPFHGILSGGMMLVTVTGRKSGRKYTTPVEYYREGDCLWVVTNRNRTWWRNVRSGAETNLLLKRKSVTAFAETELEENAVESRMYDYLQHIPRAAKPLGIRIKNGKANSEDIKRIAKDRLFVRFQLTSA
jgi:deazaflavin-dependent oxidoreductase (nitroreductase family)